MNIHKTSRFRYDEHSGGELVEWLIRQSRYCGSELKELLRRIGSYVHFAVNHEKVVEYELDITHNYYLLVKGKLSIIADDSIFINLKRSGDLINCIHEKVNSYVMVVEQGSIFMIIEKQAVQFLRDHEIKMLQSMLENSTATIQEYIQSLQLTSSNTQHDDYYKLFLYSGDPILIFNKDGIIGEANPSALELFCQRNENLAGQSIYKLIPEEMHKTIESTIKHTLERSSYEIRSYQLTMIDKHGNTLVVDCKLQLIDIGPTVFYFALLHDITDIDTLKNQLAQQVNLFETLINSIPHAIFYKDLKGRYLGCNQHFRSNIAPNILGKTARELFNKKTATFIDYMDRKLLQSKNTVQTYESSIRFNSGDDHNIRFINAIFRDPEDNPLGIVGSMFDMTHDKQSVSYIKYFQDKTIRSIKAPPYLCIHTYHQPKNYVSGDVTKTFINPQDRSFNLFLGDVTGHDLSSAILAFSTSLLISQMENKNSPSGVLTHLAQTIVDEVVGDKYLTAIFVKIQEDGLIQCANAGHPGAIVMRTDGSYHILGKQHAGFPLGFINFELFDTDPSYQDEHWQMKPGDKILLYTDGLIEIQGKEGEILGSGGLIRFLQQHIGRSGCEIREILLEFMQEYNANFQMEDDTTFHLIEYLGLSS